LIFGLALRFLPVIPGLTIMFLYIVRINLILALFNLIPVPPLDGSHILFSFLPRKAQNIKMAMSSYGLFLLLFVILFFFQYIILAVNFLTRLIIGI